MSILGSDGITLTSKLSCWLFLDDIPRDEVMPNDDLLERETRECANRAVLDVLDGGRIVEVAV